jgi:hypothetical protein
MGMYYKAKLIVGLPKDEIESDDEDMVDDLDRACGYYDCDEDSMIVGVEVESTGDFEAREISLDAAKVDAAKAKFRDLTGQDGKLYLSPHGY